MKLVNYWDDDGALKLGVVEKDRLLDVERLTARSEAAWSARSTDDLIALGDAGLATLSNRIEEALGDETLVQASTLDPEATRWAPCVAKPGKIICVGLNYRKHAEETGAQIPAYPILFNKFSNALAAHEAPIRVPEVTSKMDYEAELGIVIGKTAFNVSEDDALDYVYGYCAANDLSARDLQLRTSQWLLGKSLDGFCPLGPWLVTADEVGDPNRLEIQSFVNGERRQNSNTSDMIFDCKTIVSYISRHMTLQPGDVILTGTPEGVVMGYPEERKIYLKAGDKVEIRIEKLGTLSNVLIGSGD
ncbi:2-keto-4-pentenoate hydratase/2-oxohepta-3-ene-1,7-dioic acid hydratase (catechol pathway) [Cohnella sp. OV330]|uniref:fumarylacetoacetate hydrolase family protein n=1 Tax=Cohnella sp. OV330 TaxID=1855288 RepID=UPI0008E0E75B|nr:fumarylacetoacetate hydrolase family protein [Cohnella sp. OV330]SFB34902.1 2-keto-4-pentenoate hydratase/2-oxohepta-3-ene-1,7-dioic acid hydratase (catechol pathway) [Cohnella sp. OV330]